MPYALWDLEVKCRGKTIWDLLGTEARPVTTVFTIGIEPTAEAIAEKAAAAANYPMLKIKLDDDRPVERLKAIRSVRPDAKLIVNANQSWCFDLLKHPFDRRLWGERTGAILGNDPGQLYEQGNR